MRGMRIALLVLAAVVLAGCGGGGGASAVKKPPQKYRETDRELYETALKKMEKKDVYKARRLLEEIVHRGNQDPELQPLVQLALADTYFEKRGLLGFTDAMSRYSTFLTFYPTHEKADYAQYRLALCHLEQVYAPDRDQRETLTALNEFRKVLTDYPDSPYVDLAGEKINECLELLAEHDYRVGLFYLDRRAYLGAIDRFLGILDAFPRYARKDELYLNLADALIRTSRTEEGDVYLRKLLQSYPESKHVKRASDMLSQIGGAEVAENGP